jgi:hypothetical protein
MDSFSWGRLLGFGFWVGVSGRTAREDRFDVGEHVCGEV